MISAKPTIFLIFLLQAWTAFSFQQHIGSLTHHTTVNSNTALLMKSDMVEEKKDNTVSSRRSFFQNTMATATTAFIVNPYLALAEEAADAPPPGLFEDNGVGKTLEANIYYILRAREASAQETRLINSGKFKDAQRNNVKLAVKFIVQNYRVSDNIIAASAYIGGAKRIQANEIGQQAVQSLFTILEYFDTSDVQNIRVSDADLAGKIPLVLKVCVCCVYMFVCV